MITCKQMRALERLALKKGILPIQLMENAGKQVFSVVKEKFDLDGKHVAILAGSGNNAGDAFVAARFFVEECPIVVLFFGDEDKLTEEARTNYDRIKDKVNIIKIEKKEDLNQFHFQSDIEVVCVDALLGIGLSGEVREPITFGIDYFNSLDGIKVAVDVPSGLNADTGEGKTICDCDLIVTFHDLKIGLEGLKDKTIVVDIGIPKKEISLPS